MTDLAKVKRNIGRMIDGGASASEIDTYISQEGVTIEQLKATSQTPQPKQGGRSVAAQAVRGAELASRGFLSSLGETVGAIPELAASGLRSISPSLAPEPGYYAVGETISAPFAGLLPSDVGNFQPETQFERGAYGGGRGAADAASFAIPGMAVAKGAQAGSLAQRVGSTLAAQPALQAAAGTTAGAVQGATGNELYGLGAGLTVGGKPWCIASNVTIINRAATTCATCHREKDSFNCGSSYRLPYIE